MFKHPQYGVHKWHMHVSDILCCFIVCFIVVGTRTNDFLLGMRRYMASAGRSCELSTELHGLCLWLSLFCILSLLPRPHSYLGCSWCRARVEKKSKNSVMLTFIRAKTPKALTSLLSTRRPLQCTWD